MRRGLREEQKKIIMLSGVIILLIILIICVVLSMKEEKDNVSAPTLPMESSIENMMENSESDAMEQSSEAKDAVDSTEGAQDKSKEGVIELPFVPAN